MKSRRLIVRAGMLSLASLACCALAARSDEPSSPHHDAVALVAPAEAKFAAAAESYRSGDWQSAAEQFQAWAVDQPEHERRSDASFFAAEALVQLGRHADAAKLLAASLQREPRQRLANRARYRLAETTLLSGRDADGRALLSRFIRDFPDDPLAAHASFLLQTESRPSSGGRGAMAAESLAAPAPHVASQFFAAQELEGAEHWDAAVAAYEQVLREGVARPEAPNAMHALARLNAKLHRRRESLALYEQLVKSFPNFHDRDAALYEWAWMLLDDQQSQPAQELFATLRDEHPESRLAADAAYRLALAAWERREVDDCERLLNSIPLALLPPSTAPHALLLSAKVAIDQRQWSAAEERLLQLQREHSTHAASRAAAYWLAEVAYRSGNFRLANARLRPLVGPQSQIAEELKPVAALRLAQALGQLERWDEALAVADELAKTAPAALQYEAEYVRGRALATMGEYASAREAFERVVAGGSSAECETVAMAQWMIGETHFHQGDLEQAVAAYESAANGPAVVTWQAAALLQAGKCREQQGRRAAAVEYYERLERNFQGTTFVAEARQRRMLLEQRLASRADPAQASRVR